MSPTWGPSAVEHINWHPRLFTCLRLYIPIPNLFTPVLSSCVLSNNPPQKHRRYYIPSNPTHDRLGQVSLADEAIRIGPPPAVESYLRGDVILEAAKRSGAQARKKKKRLCAPKTAPVVGL